MQLLAIKLNLFLYEGPGREKLGLQVLTFASNRINRRILDCAILEALRALSFQVPVQMVLDVSRIVGEVAQAERYVDPMALF